MKWKGVEYPARGKVRFCYLGKPPESVGPREVLIRTCYSGVTNGTERHALLGEYGWEGAFPGTHGYQCVGRIQAAGKAVEDFSVGDWVFYGQYVGHRAWHVVDVTDADPRSNESHLVLPLHDVDDPKPYALVGVAGVAMRGVRRFRVGPGDNVWVAGQGLIGNFAGQAARAVGARVTVSDIEPKRLQAAQACGAHTVVDATEPDHWVALENAGPFDCIIDACNSDSLLREVHEHSLLNHGGVAGVLAVHSDLVCPWTMLHMTEASIEVSCHFSLGDLRILAFFIEHGIIRIEPVITHVIPIDQALDIYEILRDHPGELLGVIFDWTL